MLHVRTGHEEKDFTCYIEKALSILAKEEYAAFLDMFDSSRVSNDGLILALRYLNEDGPIMKIDDPTKVKCSGQWINIVKYNDGSGYYMDYDLTTDGELNDLTLQVEFKKQGVDYSVSLEDLHTM